ncbi:vacuolar fusion protein MON1 homolog isoform X1 [Cryptomeria japonica]|uniref:vacuolar fusion protein MON1 homolog isoform X1 n=1 Tax=Cryptomeria japonica TaxID=3369 RepID=UPI0027DAA102|nr:vacuolar fusion protein MON1 homolog isoform X1 [Cryptomeria japonica]
MARENYQIPIDSASPDEFFESYEDLFDDDDSSLGPCYLPEKINGTVKTATLDNDNCEISELTAITLEFNGDRNPNGDALSDGQTEGQSNFNKGKIDEQSAINEDQTEEQSAINGEQIEEQSAFTIGKIEKRNTFNGGQIEDPSALNGEPVGTELGKGEIKEDWIEEVENGSGLSISGYDAGTSNGGSSMSISSLGSVIGDGVVGQLSDGRGSGWLSGKEHKNEDDTSITWRKRKKHFFILSHSGKPIYSRYGDENKLAGFSATLQAIISFVENSGDNIRSVQAGNHQIVFLVKGPIYLVCISCTEEPFQALRAQLELLYGQMLLILTKSIERYFYKNSKFDMRPLLGGTDVVFSSLIHAFSWNPATFLHAYTCVPLSFATRQAAGGALQDIVDSQVLFAILMCRHKASNGDPGVVKSSQIKDGLLQEDQARTRATSSSLASTRMAFFDQTSTRATASNPAFQGEVISTAGAQKVTLHPDDILLLSNFVVSSESFRTSESFSPICVPRYNPTAFLYAYVQYLKDDIFLVVLTTDSNGFYHLRDCRIRVESVLNKSNMLSEVKRSMLNTGLCVEDLPSDPVLNSARGHQVHDNRHELSAAAKHHTAGFGGPGGLWHFMYKSIYLDQYVASEFSLPLKGHRAQKSLLRAYENLYASMHTGALGPYKMQYRRDENYTLLCWITPDFELYAAFDPLAEKSVAITTCNRVCQWLRDLENEIFLIGAAPFSW